MEIELKFLIEDIALVKEIFNDSELKAIKDAESQESIEMHAVYFDTEDNRLRREGIAFRVRKEGKKMIATLKWNGFSEDGLHKREEINIPVDSEEKIYTPDISIFKQSEMADVLETVVGGRSLKPVLDMFFVRNQVRVDTGKSISELSVDEGEIICGDKKLPILELEIELYSGDEADMRSLGRALAEKYNLHPEDRSKYARGLSLIM